MQRLKLIQIDITKIKLSNIRNLEYFDFQVYRFSFRKFEQPNSQIFKYANIPFVLFAKLELPNFQMQIISVIFQAHKFSTLCLPAYLEAC